MLKKYMDMANLPIGMNLRINMIKFLFQLLALYIVIQILWFIGFAWFMTTGGL